jgi:hypothetical protein
VNKPALLPPWQLQQLQLQLLLMQLQMSQRMHELSSQILRPAASRYNAVSGAFSFWIHHVCSLSLCNVRAWSMAVWSSGKGAANGTWPLGQELTFNVAPDGGWQ